MDTGSTLSASLEDYLEAIYHIEHGKQVARAKDIAERMNVTGASVTGALQALARRKLINYAPYELITLTEKGRAAAREVVSRHKALHRFFVDVLDIEEEIAQEAACRMEHALPRGILDRLTRFVEYLTSGGEAGGREFIENFKSRADRKR